MRQSQGGGGRNTSTLHKNRKKNDQCHVLPAALRQPSQVCPDEGLESKRTGMVLSSPAMRSLKAVYESSPF